MPDEPRRKPRRKPPAGARLFAEGLFEFLHGRGKDEERFARWCAVVGKLPRRQTRVLTWPVVSEHCFWRGAQ